MKQFLLCFLALFCLLTGCAPAQQAPEPVEIISYTDDLGRTVELPAEIETVVPAGTVAQMMLYAVAPEKLAGLAADFFESQKEFYPEEIQNLPVYGQFYGSKSTTNYEAILAAQPDVIIDIGEAKPSIAQDLDEFSQKTGIPIVFLQGELDSFGQTFTKLGQLLGEETQAADLTSYCDTVLESLKTLPTGDTRVLYVSTNGGVQVFGRNSVQVTVMDRVGAINACPNDAVAGNGADTVNMEEVLRWEIDKILVAGDPSILETDPIWSQIPAIQAGEVYQIPDLPYSYFGRPPSVQQFLGIQWFSNLLYPEVYEFDETETAAQFNQLFFHYPTT